MLQVKIEVFDNEDHIMRSREFSEEPVWMDLILMCADVISSRYGYNIVDRIKFIGDNTTIYDRADGHMIPPAAWAEFLNQDFIQPEFDFNKQDDEEWS
jgi:hypothetical protein